MKPGVDARDAEQVPALAQGAHLRDHVAQLVDGGGVGVERGVPSGETLERGAGLEYLHRLAFRHTSHPCSAVPLVLHEPIVLEADEGHSHGRPTQPELRAQIFLEQALARRQLSTDNRVAEILVSRRP